MTIPRQDRAWHGAVVSSLQWNVALVLKFSRLKSEANDHLVLACVGSPSTMEDLRPDSAIEINVVDPFLRKGYRFKEDCLCSLTRARVFRWSP